jgi:hypothetical protein
MMIYNLSPVIWSFKMSFPSDKTQRGSKLNKVEHDLHFVLKYIILCKMFTYLSVQQTLFDVMCTIKHLLNI